LCQLVPATGPREFVLSHVYGDGRCLWRAMVDALADDTLDKETQTKKADELCRQVADYLMTEEGCCTTVQALIEGGGDSIEAHCTKMKRCEQEAHWGGEAELLAMSRLLEAHIELYTTAESTKNDGVVNATPTPVPGDLKATAATPHSATPAKRGWEAEERSPPSTVRKKKRRESDEDPAVARYLWHTPVNVSRERRKVCQVTCRICGAKCTLLCSRCSIIGKGIYYGLCNPTTGRDCLAQHMYSRL